MNRREKILAVVVGSILGVAILYGVINRMVLSRGRELSTQAHSIGEAVEKLETENMRLTQYRGLFADFRDRSFDDNPRRASVLADTTIKQLAKQAGLGQSDYTVGSFAERREANAYRELLCTITGTSSLERITNFLYLLGRDTHLHRVTHLSLKRRQEKKGRTKVAFTLRYSTLVFDGNIPVSVPSRPTETQPPEAVGLNTPEREIYNVIASRDVFSPYVRPPDRHRPDPQPQPHTQPAPTPQSGRLVVTGLPSIAGKHEVHIAIRGQDVKKVLKVGDSLPIGKIVMVDYRLMPMPGKPHLISQCRVILKAGKNYWAIERGQRLDQRRILRPEELPEKLRTPPASTQPTTMPNTVEITETEKPLKLSGS
jgi:hypothetical protein